MSLKYFGVSKTTTNLCSQPITLKITPVQATSPHRSLKEPSVIARVRFLQTGLDAIPVLNKQCQITDGINVHGKKLSTAQLHA